MRMLKCSAVAILTAALLAAVPVRAQEPAVRELPKFFGVFSTTVGGWAEYAVTETDTGKKSTMRNAIVGKDGDAVWYEVVLTEGGSRNVIKMSLKGDPNNPDNIQRLIMKSGNEHAMEMPREFVVLGRRMATAMFESRSGSTVAAEPGLKAEEIGSRTVTVPAGTYTTVRNRIVDGTGKVLATYDVNKDVLPFGVVLSETESVKMELVATGKDATSVITEEPVMMKTPPGMPETNPRGKPPGMGAPQGGPPSGGYGAPAPGAPDTGGYGK